MAKTYDVKWSLGVDDQTAEGLQSAIKNMTSPMEKMQKQVSIPYRFNESRFVYIIYTSTYDLFYGQKRPFISSTRNDVKTAGGRQDICKLKLSGIRARCPPAFFQFQRSPFPTTFHFSI